VVFPQKTFSTDTAITLRTLPSHPVRPECALTPSRKLSLACAGGSLAISGHKTAEIFRRYDITDEGDLAEVAAALDRKREADKSLLSHNSLVAKKQAHGEHQQAHKIQ